MEYGTASFHNYCDPSSPFPTPFPPKKKKKTPTIMFCPCKVANNKVNSIIFFIKQYKFVVGDITKQYKSSPYKSSVEI